MRNYDFSGSSYASTMETKQNQYRRLINQAERMRMQKGVPSKAEAQFYNEAAKVCAEIMNLNLSERSVHAKWKALKEDCEDNVRKIINALRPAAPASAPAEEPEPATVKKPAQSAAGAEASRSAVTTSKTGFTTKFAEKDVPASTIEKWFKKENLNHDFEGVTGMEKEKARLLRDISQMGYDKTDEALQICPAKAYLFYGPPGGGKTYLIEAFAKELTNRGFQYMKLVGGEIHASLVGVAEKTIHIAMEEAIDKAPCILFIDEYEGVCANRNSANITSNEKRLTDACLEALNMMFANGKNVIFVAATNYPDMVDDAMMDRFEVIPTSLPSSEERSAYFQRKFSPLRLEAGFSYEEMAFATEDYSYRDLDRLSGAINNEIKGDEIETHQVQGADGEIDREKTDEAISQAILGGQVVLTSTLFYEMQAEIPVSNKSGVLERLAAYEARRNA